MVGRTISLLALSVLAASVAAAPQDADLRAWNPTFSIDQGNTHTADAGQNRLSYAMQGPASWSRDTAASLQFDELSGVSVRYNIVRLAAGMARSLPRDFLLRAAVQGQYDRQLAGPYSIDYPAPTLLSGRAGEPDGFNDFGMAANVELYSPDLCGRLAWRPCRAMVFYDKSYIRRNREQSGALRSGYIGSAGFGLRMQISDNANLQFDYGYVLRSGVTEANDKARLHVRVGLDF